MKRQIFTSNDNLAPRYYGRPLSLVVLALGLIGGNVNAQLAAVPCGTSVLDFGEGPPDSATLPPNMGESSPTNVAVALRGVSPSKVGWYSQARDHTTENTTGTGYFLAIDSYNLLPAGSVIYQLPITGLTAGETYAISMWVTSIFDQNAPEIRVQVLDGASEVAGTSPVLTTVTDNAATHLPWQQVSWTITAPAGSLMLQVMEPNGHPAAWGYDLGIDDIKISQTCTPPPSTLAPVPVDAPLALGGLSGALLGIGLLRQRRRKRKQS